MSKVCGSANCCPYAPEQTTSGCPCADLCPGYCKDAYTFTSTATIPCDLSHPMSGYTSSSNYTEGKT